MTEKLYRIGEASEMLQLKSYVLRFWETEFSELEPLRTEKGQRLYTEKHIALLQRIKHLLHERGMTIDGARRILFAEQDDSETLPQVPKSSAVLQGTDNAPVSKTQDSPLTTETVATLRQELLDIRRLLTY